MADIYLLIEGKQEGPYTEDQLRQSLANGQIPPDLPAWHEGLPGDWVSVSSIVDNISQSPKSEETPSAAPQAVVTNSSQLSVSRNGSEIGEWTEDEVRVLYAQGELFHTDCYWREGMAEWKQLGTFLKPPPPSPQAPPLLSSESSPVTISSTTTQKSRSSLRGISPELLGSYARSNLHATEIPLFKTTIHGITIAGPAVITFLFFILCFVSIISGPFFILAFFKLVVSIINYSSSEFVVTDQRVLIKVGFISRRTLEMFITKMESIGLEQNIGGRIFGYGTLAIRGTGGSVERFPKIAHPFEFRSCVQNIQTQLELK